MSIYVGTQVIPTPGNVQALLGVGERYNKLVEKSGGKVVGNWQITLGEGQGTYAILSSWPDRGCDSSVMGQADDTGWG